MTEAYCTAVGLIEEKIQQTWIRRTQTSHFDTKILKWKQSEKESTKERKKAREKGKRKKEKTTKHKMLTQTLLTHTAKDITHDI